MQKYFKNIFPSLAVTLSLLVLPIALTVYYIVSTYSNSFVSEQNINYFDVQGNFLGKALFEQGWVAWFNRFMDFAIWGLMAAIVLVAMWLISSAKVATKNHYAEETFANFKMNQKTWHRHFFVVAGLRVILAGIIMYSVVAIIGKSVPQIETTVSLAMQEVTTQTIKNVALAAGSVFVLQYLIITSIKTFRHLNLD